MKHILPHIPEDVERVCSPFFGGGSVELALASKGVQVFGYDKMKQLVWFWQGLCSDNQRLADEVENLREQYQIRTGDTVTGCPKQSFLNYREDLKTESFMFSYEKAAKYYAINRSSFSGATFSGGWSERSSYARFTDSSVERLRDFKAEKFRVDYADFQLSIPWHPRAFLYLDPPYMLPDEAAILYGDAGNLHTGFDHMALYKLISNRKGWLLSYNDCPEIRELYTDYEIIPAQWAYGMKNVKWEEGKLVGKKKMGSSSEILIKG